MIQIEMVKALHYFTQRGLFRVAIDLLLLSIITLFLFKFETFTLDYARNFGAMMEFYINIVMLSLYFSLFFGSLFLFYRNQFDALLAFIYSSITFGLLGLIVFIMFVIDPKVGLWSSHLTKLGISLILLYAIIHTQKKILIEIFLFIVALPLLVLFITWLGTYGELNFNSLQPLIANIYGHYLPVDSWLPRIFAEQLVSGNVYSPMVGSWLSSDRPPLQAALNLLLTPVTTPANVYSYVAYSISMQLLIILFLSWMFTTIFQSKLLRFLLFILIFYNGFVFVNSLFVWPKLLAALYQAIVFYALYQVLLNEENSRKYYTIFGIALSLSLLSHGGGLFFFLGQITILFFILYKRKNILSFFSMLGVMFLTYLPWLIYQKFIDPPGDRLLKYHLAEYGHPTDTSVLDLLIAKYSSFTLDSYIDHKLWQFNTIFGDMFEKYIKLFDLTAQQIIHRNFAQLEYSYLFMSICMLLLLFIVKFSDKKIKTFVYLGTVSFLSYLLFWFFLLLTNTTLHVGSYFGWFLGLIVIFLTLYHFNKYIAILLLVANVTMTSITFIKKALTIPKYVTSDTIQNTTYVRDGVPHTKGMSELIIYGSYINGDSDKAKITFQTTTDSTFFVKSLNPKNQMVTIKDLQHKILRSTKMKKTGHWEPYKFFSWMPYNVIVEIEDNGTGANEWSAIALKE
jgi:hypothetical protein